MKRIVGSGNTFLLLKAGSDSPEFVEIDNPGSGFEKFNELVGAECGEIVLSRELSQIARDNGIGGCIELWIDDEGAIKVDDSGVPVKKVNKVASIFVGQLIFGDALVILTDPTTGESGGFDRPTFTWLDRVIRALRSPLREQIVAAMMSQMVAQWDEWMRLTKGTGVQIIEVPAEDAKGGAA